MVRSGSRVPVVVSGVITGLTLAMLPLAGRHLGPTTSFVPAILATVACFDVMSVWLLAGDYIDTGDRRLLGTTAAYMWSLVLMVAYALAFPGVFSADPPFAVTASMAPYFYIGWHAGFPLLLGLAWCPWRGLDRPDLQPHARPRVLATVLVSVLALSSALVGLLLLVAGQLPVLIVGLDTTGMVRVTAPIAVPTVLLALVLCVRGTRGRSGPERWVPVAVLVCTCDLALTYTGRFRFSLGWYAGRTLTVAAAAVLLCAMLASFRRLKATAETNAAYDYLTGLPNRRTAFDLLTALMARAGRMDTALSVLLLDLDHFKRVNDDYGHAIGDEVLRAVADALRSSLRQSDLAARIGGEEFLILLPDADEASAGIVAARIRAALASGRSLPDGSPITASIGVATVAKEVGTAEALVQRADSAMYAAKASGRDRIAVAGRA